jgi:hypothetical protein
MGCDLLALDLVRNWEFLKPQPTSLTRAADEVPDPTKLLGRRSSLVVADLPITGDKTIPPGLKPPPPKAFEEPEASSLLDSFGF